MRAAVYHGQGDIRVEEHPAPVAGPGEVVVRIGAAGICGSDAAEYTLGPQLILPGADGTITPVVLGHEFAGTVESVGEGVTGLVPGAQVVCGAGVSCGHCRMCVSGRTNLCRSYHTLGFHRDGGLAEFVSVPAGILLDVSAAGLPMDTLALAQPMAVAVHAVRRSGLRAGQEAVVVGAGGIGAFLSYAAAATGARILVVDRNAERLELARELGASDTLVAGERDLGDHLRELGWEPDVFFEVSGSAAGFEQVLAAALPGATIVPVGIQKSPPPEALGKWTLREYTVLGTVALVFAEDLPEAVRLLGERDDWSDFTGRIIPLDAVVSDGIELLASGSSPQIKTLIDPWATSARAPQHTRTLTP